MPQNLKNNGDSRALRPEDAVVFLSNYIPFNLRTLVRLGKNGLG